MLTVSARHALTLSAASRIYLVGRTGADLRGPLIFFALRLVFIKAVGDILRHRRVFRFCDLRAVLLLDLLPCASTGKSSASKGWSFSSDIAISLPLCSRLTSNSCIANLDSLQQLDLDRHRAVCWDCISRI